MKQSQLVAIIKRLEAMQAGDGETQSRRFEKNGDEKGLVTYDPKTETYELEELGTHQTFQFDNITSLINDKSELTRFAFCVAHDQKRLEMVFSSRQNLIRI